MMPNQIRKTRYHSYGNMYSSQAYIHYPKTIDEIRHILQIAKIAGQKITLAGTFHSFDKQNSGNDIVISMKKFTKIKYLPNEHCIEVEPGVRWAAIVKFAYKHHCVPYAFITGSQPTVGGTLSAHTNCVFTSGAGKEGKYCIEIDLLCTNGDIITCSRHQNSDIFYGAISGLGMLGIIVRAKIKLMYIGSPFAIKITTRTYHEVADLENRFSLRAIDNIQKLEELKSEASLYYYHEGKYKFVIYNREYERTGTREITHFNIYLYLASILAFVIRFFPNYANKIMAADENKNDANKMLLRGLRRIFYGTFWAEADYIWMKYISKCLKIFGYKSKLYQNSYFIPLKGMQVTAFVQQVCTLLQKYNLATAMFDVMYIPKDEPFILSASRYTDGFYVNTTFFDTTNVPNLMQFYSELNVICRQMDGKINLVKNIFIDNALLQDMYKQEVNELFELKKITDPEGLIASNFFKEYFAKG
ncbi:MAG: FAD-binding protein [Cytophagales bacterium]|nr:FAD-binding protein [Cytophagales bacterium]